MEYQSISSESSVIVTGDSEQGSEQGNIFVTVQVINELREKINNLQCELQHLKGRDTTPTDLLFQEDLNKLKSGMKVCSNAIQSTNDLFKTYKKKNTEISNELKALKRERNGRFDEEKEMVQRRNELLDFLYQEMGNLENRTKLLGNEIKNVRDGLKWEHEQLKASSNAIQSIKDFLNNSDKRITETSNEVKALKEHIINGLLVRMGTSDDVSFVTNEDLTELRNGILNIYSKEIEQVHEKSKQQGKEIKNIQEGLKKQQEKVGSVMKSTISIKNQCKDTNGKQIMIENSIKQCSNEIQKLQLELKAEQEKNIILENKLITFECHLEEILLRNDMKQNPNKETCTTPVTTPRTTPVTKSCSQRSDFLTETCIVTMSDSKVNKKPSQIDMPLKLLTKDFTWLDITHEDPDSVGFSEEARRKYVGEGINQPDNKEQESMDSLLQKEETFYEQESSASSACSQSDELSENKCVDLAFDSTSGKDGALLYLQKAQDYLQNLHMPGMFTLSDEESLAVSDEEISAVSDIESLVTFEPGNDAKKHCAEKKKKKKKRSRKKTDRKGDTILNDKIEWVIRDNVKPMKDKSYQSRVFYTGTPGYRLQVLAKIDRQEGEIFFCLRILKGVYDDSLEWPCQQGISVKVSEKMQSTGVEYWFIPEKGVLTKPKSRCDKVYTEWFGPFNLSRYLNSKNLIFDIYLE